MISAKKDEQRVMAIKVNMNDRAIALSSSLSLSLSVGDVARVGNDVFFCPDRFD